MLQSAGTWMTVILLGCLAYYLYTKEIELTGNFLVTLALFTVALIVYSLPHMHERYGCLADILAILYAMMNWRRFYIPVVLWADTIPMIGMLMIPKTCAYVWTVLIGYFAMKNECK